MKGVLANNLNDHETYLSSTDFKIENVVENFNTALEKSFLDCELPKRELGSDDDELNKLEGKELWDRIDWSGKLASTKDTVTPDSEDLFKHFKNSDAPADEPPVEITNGPYDVYLPVTDDPISIKEIVDAFQVQKKGYNYTNVILRPFITIILPHVYILMNMVFFASSEIIKWAPSMLFAITKKGILKLTKNWRGIQMGEYINSWYDRILCNRIKLWMSVDEFQSVYQKGKSCNTQQFTFRTITELAQKMKTPIYISSVDLEKAFDKVKRETLFRVLQNLGNGSAMLNALKTYTVPLGCF